MAQEQMLRARDLIRAKKYKEARQLLVTVDHPKAKEWLTKIDETELGDPFQDALPKVQPLSKHTAPTVSPEVAAARAKSYTNAAVIVLVLYFLLWVPGLIANILYLNEAKAAQKLADDVLPGVTALMVEQIILGVLPVILGIVLVVSSVLIRPV